MSFAVRASELSKEDWEMWTDEIQALGMTREEKLESIEHAWGSFRKRGAIRTGG